MIDVVKETCRVIATPSTVELEMQMLRCSTSGAPNKTNGLSSLYLVANLNEILRLMTIACTYAVGVLYIDTVAIAREDAGANDLAVETCENLIIRAGLQIYSAVVATSDIGAYNLASRQGI